MESDFRAIIMHGFSDDEALAVMRAVRAIGFDRQSTAFATTTPTSIGWKVGELIEHLEMEHSMARKAKA